MVLQDMAVDKELLCATPTGAADGDANAYGSGEFGSDDLGGFASAEDLEDFLRNFSDGNDEEATVETQGEDDVGGEPISTIH